MPETPQNPLEMRMVDTDSEEWQIVKALSTRIAAFCSEFELTHAMTAVCDLLGHCLSEIKPEVRDEAMQTMFMMIESNRKYHEEKDITVIDEGRKDDGS